MLKRILLLFLIVPIGTGFKQNTAPIRFGFEKFPYSDKLPSNSVIRIYNDKEGYMWFGTQDGLCRFDGYNVKVFRSSALTPGRLTNNEIQCIAEDNSHQLWIGTIEGINIVDKGNFSIRSLDNKYINKQRINSIFVDSKNYVWIGTSNYGVLRMDPKTGKFDRFSMEADSPVKLKGNNIINIYEDRNGNIWLSLWRAGLCCLDAGLKKITYAPKIGNTDNPFRFFQDKEGIYWVCTWGDGIFNLSLKSNSTIEINPVKLSRQSVKMTDHIVYSITEDDQYGYIWVVTFGGLRILKKETDNTYTFTDADSFFGEPTNKLFHEIIKDRQGNLWIGSVGEGLYKLDFNKLSIQNFQLSEVKKSWSVPPYVTHFCEFNSEEVLITIARLGIFSFNVKTGEVRRPTDPVINNIRSIKAMIHVSFANEIWLANEGENIIQVFKTKANDIQWVYSFPLQNSRYAENDISYLFEDSKKNVWIGSFNGVDLKLKNGPVKHITSKIQFINSIAEDSENNIWIGTEKEGVFICKQINGNAANYTITNLPLKAGNIQSYNVQSICCRKNKDVYIGTKEGCLYLYDRKKNVAADISGVYGISDESILAIVEDNSGLLWLSTTKKIIRYNPKTHTSTYFSVSDGLLMSMFFKGACIKLETGKILFGGNKGICMFDPAVLNTSLKAQKKHVLISDILIQNKSIFDDNADSHFSSKKNRITLQNSESNLNIEFCAPDYSSANKIQYAYMLSGIDNNWIYVGNNRRFVNYSNLPAGKYKFMVMASDENGLWSNEITSLQIVIMPPPYKTWWAYLIYLCIVMAVSYFAFKMIINRIHLRNELKISQIEKEKSEELAQIKLRYFTNISHELLTPLTIILLLIESLKKKNNSDVFQFEMIKTNANRLKRLIQQILAFRKTESGNLKLKITENDIISFVRNICSSDFQPLITEKEINFSINSEYENYMAWFDSDKVDKILYNLLSNAFKYTPQGGKISVKVSFVERHDIIIMRLSVSDTGSGISENDLPHIFKRFYTSSKSDPSQSHGIGLSLTNELLLIHKGNIEVKSSLGEGSVFTIEIPVSKNAYSEKDFTGDENLEPGVLQSPSQQDTSDSVETEDQDRNNEDYTILVVEDNKELQNIIVEHFAKIYKVMAAENGNQAIEIVRENEIDLVVSDIMMPEMDGLTLCRILKNDINTSHVSVLMLTAKNSTEDRIECYNAGADAYISKPFELRVLAARAKNLIGKRQQKTRSFQSNEEVSISSMEYGSMDEEFLKQAILTVEAKMSDTSFDFDQFALDLGASKSTLHRKLKSLTGLAPGEFIRHVRLKHAFKMIINNTGNISEVAYAVGFNDPKYFSRLFKKQFGQSPSDYLEHQQSDKFSST